MIKSQVKMPNGHGERYVALGVSRDYDLNYMCGLTDQGRIECFGQGQEGQAPALFEV